MKNLLKKVTISSMLIFAFSLVCTFSIASAQKIGSISDAKSAALKNVPSAKVIEVDTDMDNGTLVYEVELLKSGKEYNLEYRASDGKLMKYEWEITNPAYTNQNKKNLSKNSIKNKALNKVKNATFVSITLTHDDGMAEYKVRLKKDSKNYKLVYNSKNGKLLEYEWEIPASAWSTDTSASANNNKYIGVEKAKEIALEKVPDATIVKAKFDTDDGVEVYEVEMVKGKYEYEVKINAKTGKIIEFEKDIND